MGIHFTKMHSLGNDFMVIDAVRQSIQTSVLDIRAWGNRHTGIGFDQCLLVEPSDKPGIDFFYRIFNANGNEVGQCGNGARCLARFVARQALTTKKMLCVGTHTTKLNLELNENDTVTVHFEKPRLLPSEIPMNKPLQEASYEIPLKACTVKVHAVNVGNPHAVLLVDDFAGINVDAIGKEISQHPLFPQQTNVGFMQLRSDNQVDLRVYERDCGETMACGSGAVAAAAIGRLFYHLRDDVTVTLPGGDLLVSWPHMNGAIYLTGPAEFVYDGVLL